MKPLSVLRGSLDFCKSKALYGYLLGLSLYGWGACSAVTAGTLNPSWQNTFAHNQAISATDFSSSQSVTGTFLAQGSSRIYTIIGLRDIEAILKDTDILYKRESPTLLRFDVGSYKILAILQGCKDNDSGDSCNSLLLTSRVRLSSRPSATLVNDWNRVKRGSRAYIDTNDVLVLEADVYAIGGITEQHLRSRVASFVLAVGSFAEHMGLR